MLNLGLLKPEWLEMWDDLTEEERQTVYSLIQDDSGLSKYCPQEPTPKQWEFINHGDLEVFYGGAAAGGKSSSLLMAALQYVDVPEYSAIIFRRTYADLSLPGAIMDRALSWLKGKPGIHWSPTDKKFTFPSGATLAFGYLDS